MNAFHSDCAGRVPAANVRMAVWKRAVGPCFRGLLGILVIVGWLGSVGRSIRKGPTGPSQRPIDFPVAMADPVQALLEQCLLIKEIAERLGVCRDTITKVVKYLRAVRGLDIPDGRTRRKGLDRKVSRPRGCDEPHNDDTAAA